MNKKYAAFGVIGISLMLAAEPVCRRIVLPAIHRHHSAATLARWKEWNLHHKAPARTPAELDLYCPEVPTEDATVSAFLVPEDAPTLSDREVEPAITQDALPATDTTQPSAPLAYAGFSIPPSNPNVPPAITPEPSTILLLFTGFIGIGGLFARRRIHGS